MRTILATLALFFATASLAVAQEKVVRVGLHLDAFAPVPEWSAADRGQFDDDGVAVTVEGKEFLEADAIGKVFRVRGMKVGKGRVVFAAPNGKKQVVSVEVVEKLDEPERKNVTLRVGDHKFLGLDPDFAEGGEFPLIALCRPEIANLRVVSSRRVQVSGLVPGVTGMSLRSGSGDLQSYRVTVLAADAKRVDGVDGTPRSVRRGEALRMSESKEFAASAESRANVLSALEEKVSGIVVGPKEFVVFGHQLGECDVSVVDAHHNVGFYRLKVIDEKIEIPADDKGLAELGLKKAFRLKVGGAAELPLQPGTDWNVYKAEEELARANGFGPLTTYIRAVNPAVVVLKVGERKGIITGKAAGVTDVIVVKNGELVGIYRVQVE
jgi:hypothetical protein